MKRSEGLFQKMFGGGFGLGSSRVPLRSNVYNNGKGYSQIGGTGKWANRGQRDSALLGTASPSNRITGYYERHDELESYQLIDICKLCSSFFADYCLGFLEESGQQAVSILNEDGTTDEVKTERLNEILLKDLKIFDYIHNHIKDYVFFGEYASLICKTKDELGHLRFRFEELYDSTAVITKKKRDKDGFVTTSYLTRGEDGKIYEVKGDDAFVLGEPTMKLINDLDEENKKDSTKLKPTWGKVSKDEGVFDKIVNNNSFLVGEPLFYSLILKVKELIIKELLVSLISLRDLSSIQLFLLQFDKSTPMETANELCARTTRLANNTNELASFMTSQFDVTSFIENTLSQSAKFVPDYNATIGNKNSMLNLDKLSDKLLELMQNLDFCRAGILSPLGIPSSILDSSSGSKWVILQQSERANSKVTSFMTGLRSSVVNLVCSLHNLVYGEKLDPRLVKLHISEKTSVEYNNQINQSESVSSLVGGISGILSNSLQTLEMATPLLDPKAFLSYVQSLIKDIDPNTEPLINEQTIEMYSNYILEKTKASAEQMGVDPSVFIQEEEKGV